MKCFCGRFELLNDHETVETWDNREYMRPTESESEYSSHATTRCQVGEKEYKPDQQDWWATEGKALADAARKADLGE